MRKKTSITLDVETLEYLHYKREHDGQIIGKSLDNMVREVAENDSKYQQHKKDKHEK